MGFLNELVRLGILKENQISLVEDLATKKYEGNTEKALMEFGISDETLLELKSTYFKLPSKVIGDQNISFDVLKYIPEDSARHYDFVPIGLEGGVLHVGVIDPENMQAMDALQFISAKMNVPFKIFLISEKDFEKVLGNYHGITGEVDTAVTEFDSEELENASLDVETNKIQNLSKEEEERIVEDAPIIKIVAVILRHATEGNASDIHIENNGEQVKVRFRVDGVLHTSLVLPLNVYNGVVARIKILSKLRLDEKRKPQDGGFSAKIEGRKIDFRVSTLPTYYGEKVVMRILDSEKGVQPIDKLHLSPENLAMLKRALAKPYGLILITGPTGSGKSTTLYSMLNELDREKSNVVSLEDPVEYHMPNMNQSQVMPEIGYTFAAGLRSILRQDPDIIMVGEIRDKETAQLAIQAALTGHLVLSTLHTNSAIGVVPRLVDMGVDPYLIAPTLILSMAQRLVRVSCPNAKVATPIDGSIKEMIDRQFADLPEEFRSKLPIKDTVYETKPTDDCPTGMRGREAVFEMYEVNKDLQTIILKNPVEQEIYKYVRSKGMLTMKEDAILKSAAGDIPFQEVHSL